MSDSLPEASTTVYRERQTAAVLSLVIGFVLLLFKFWAFNLTHSEAVFSDAMESIVNVFAALFLVNIIRLSAAPPDQNHPYGHGKFEFFASAFEGGMITFAGLAIIYVSVDSLSKGHPLNHLSAGLAIVAGCAVVNLLLGLLLIRIGRRNHSLALQADGAHLITDFVTSAGVFLGLGLVHVTGWVWLDPVIAIVFAGVLLLTGYQILRRSAAGLTDEEDRSLITSLQKLTNELRFEGMIQIHHARIIRSGDFHHIDAHIVVPEFWNVSECHEKTDLFAADLIQKYPFNGEVAFHVDPCRRVYCAHCDLVSCPIRQNKFENYLPVDIDTLTSPEEPNL